MNNILSLDAFDAAMKRKGWNLKHLADEYDKKYPSDDGKSVYNTLRQWRGPKGNPTLRILIRICDLLECDIDYLIGRMNEQTHTNKFIKDETGLSEPAIYVLLNWKKIGDTPGNKYAWARNSIQAINDLIEQGIWFSHNVLNPISEYCCFRKIYETKNIPDRTRTQALNKYRLALFTATNGFTDCIKAIYEKGKTPDTK